MLTDAITKKIRLQLIREKLFIRDKKKETVPFIPNKAQQYYLERATRRNIILKARQKGITKIIDADQLMQCMIRPTTAVVISHERQSTERLFEAVKFYVQTMRRPPIVSIDSASMMKFPRRGSSFFVGTAGQKAFGRGDTIDRAHLSEAAFYPDLAATLSGVTEAAEYGQIDIESTANGRERFHEEWVKAVQGKSPYTPIFIPWFIDGEYSADSLSEEERLGFSATVRELFDTPDNEIKWTDEEKDLWRRVKREYDISLTAGQVKWRRYKIWDKGDLFFQEYPEDDVSCFLQSGRSVFKHIKIDAALRIPLDNLAAMKPEDRKRLIGDPKNRKLLYAGLDPSEGTPDGDRHVFSVIEPHSQTGRAVVIFELASNDPIDVFAMKVAQICEIFNIQLGVEKNGVGVAMCRKLDELEVSFDEWTTSATTRPVMVTELEEAYRKEELIETYEDAEAEARAMVYNDNNRPEHPPGQHDDRVFSRAIALQQLKVPTPSLEFF